MAKALEGFVLVDLTTELWASLAAAMLGDFGAEVIRVEDPSGAMRESAYGGDDPHEPGTLNWRFDLANRNKKSLAVDLDGEAGRKIVGDLIARADAVITDRPRAWLADRALDYETIAAAHPRIIYARGSGFGPRGPDADLPAIDELAAAHTGMMGILPQPDQPPVYPAHGQMYTTVMLAFGIVTAWYHRERTGEGQAVDASLLAGNMYGASLDLQAYLAIGGERFLRPISRLDAGNPMSGTLYRASDGRWVTLTMPDTDRWWPQLAEVTGLDANDPRFDSHDKRCGENRLELIALLEEAFAKKSADHWRDVFTERQMSADIIEEYSYPEHDADARANRYLLDLDDASLGRLTMLGFPIFMTETPAGLDRTAPRLGQHSAEVLHELLGYSPERIRELTAAGVIAG